MSDSLEDKIRNAGGPVNMLRRSNSKPDTGPVTGSEVTNWRDEQTGWHDTCAMFDLSHHMTDVYIEGKDTLALLSHVGVNSWANFQPGQAKQIVGLNEDGFIIGDAILEYLHDGTIRLAGTPALPNWIQYQAETGGFDVHLVRDEATALNPNGHPKVYRLQVQGPHAVDLLTKVNGGPLPTIKFFRTANLTIAGVEVLAMGHNMARSHGFELIGPWADVGRVRGALMEAGHEFGLRVNGSRAPTAATLESGWVPAPLPAIYSGEAMKPYREWLPANSYEASGALGGSYTSDQVSDFYMTPHDLDYMRLVKFDHDFIGRKALEAKVDAPHRKKVTLEWNTEDVVGLMASQFGKDTPGKGLEFPTFSYSTWPYDKIVANGKTVGISTFAGYSYNERKALSLGVVDPDVEIGSEIVVVWGEEDAGASKANVETHRQVEIRAKVFPVPYSDVHWK